MILKDDIDKVFFQMSQYKYFNSTYPTLLLNLHDPETLTRTAPTIGYNSNIYYTNPNFTNVELSELFSYGLHLHNTTIVTRTVQNWRECNDYRPNYGRRARGNFQGTMLRGVTVVRKFIVDDKFCYN